MLTAKQAFENAVQHFPEWMDIRKRKNKSIGGNYLRSFTDEANGIAEALEEYRKGFFAYHYVGKEHEIVDYVLSVTIGLIDVSEFILLSPALKVTEDAKAFSLDQDSYAYYEEGKLLLKYNPSVKSIEYSLGGHKYSAATKRLHLWNVFDEFALYTGIERQDGERNKALLDRCLLMYKNVPNSTEAGLKNAIINELSQLEAISGNDIRISKVGEDNIHKEDKDGMSVSEHVIMNDADTYRGKVWNKNLWTHDFKKLTFASHKWDVFIKNKQSGTGQGSNLRSKIVEEMSEDKSTDVTISVYKESKIKINEYLKNNRRKTEMPITLTKYNDELSPLEVEYKITAESIIEITNEPIYVESYEKNSGEMTLLLEDLIIDRHDKEYQIVPGGTLESGRYKLRFVPKSAHSKMEIEKAELTINNSVQNLLKEKESFFFYDETLKSNLAKFYGSRIEDFYLHSDVRNTANGMTLSSAAADGQLVMDVTNISNQYIRYGVKAVHSDITFSNEYVSSSGFSAEGGKWICRESAGSFIIEGKVSQISYTIEKGNVGIYTTIDGRREFKLSNGLKTHSHEFDSPTEIHIEIQKMNNASDVIIRQIRYAHYSIDFTISSGDLIKTAQGIAIPDSSGKRYVTASIKTYTGFSPVIEYVYIGSNMSNVSYETDEFVIAGEGKLSIDSTCDVELIHVNTGDVEKNYSTATRYYNGTPRPVYAEIDVSMFENLISSSPAIEPISYKNKNGYYVKIEPHKEFSQILITGELLKTKSRKKLSSLLTDSSSAEIFASKQLKGFLIRDNGTEELKQIRKEHIDEDSSLIKITGLPAGINASFVTDEVNNKEVVDTTYSNFDFMYLFPKDSVQHVAYNRERIFGKETLDINIIDLFHPRVPENALLAYNIESDRNLKGVSVCFKNGFPWSIGKKQIDIFATIEAIAEQFSTEKVAVSHNFFISDYMSFDEVLTADGKEYELSRYKLELPEGFDISYEEKLSDFEYHHIKNDGFNKLEMSNVLAIDSLHLLDGTVIDSSKYELFHDEGIIYWKDSNLVGEVFVIVYKYGAPSYARVVDIHVLYDLLGYALDAMELLYEIDYQGLTDNRMLFKEDREAIEKGDHLIVKSSNPLMNVRVENQSIVVEELYSKYKTTNVFVEPGYYYASQKEWYKFANPNEKEVGGTIGINIIEGERLNDEIILSQASSNFLKNTNMLSDDLRTVCEIDLVKNAVYGIETMAKLTASDMYHKWHLFEMNLSFEQGHNGKGIKMEPLSQDAYAVLDITDYIYAGCRISAYAESTLGVYVAKQKIGEDFESVFGEEIVPMNRADDFVYHVFAEKEKAFLLVKGNGVIDDIICTAESNPMSSVHTKNIDKLGFVIPEHEEEGYRRILLFDKNHNTYEQAEIDTEGIRTSTTISWGLTKLYEYKGKWMDATRGDVLITKGSYVKTEEKPGVLYLPPLKLDKKENIQSLYIRINNVLFESMKGFAVNVLTGRTEDGEFSVVGTEYKENLIKISGARIQDYVKLVISMQENKVIENVEVYAEYAETTNSLTIRHNTRGRIYTKMFDAGKAEHYQVSKINLLDTESLGATEFFIRAFRQNEKDMVATSWVQIQIDEDGHAINEIRFKDYEYFQFRIDMNREVDRANIHSFELEVIS